MTHIPGNAEDERYPALGWQAFAAQRMVQRLANITECGLALRLRFYRAPRYKPLHNERRAETPRAVAPRRNGESKIAQQHISEFPTPEVSRQQIVMVAILL